MRFTVTHSLSKQRVADVLTSALEGGSNYWYRFVDTVEPTAWTFESDPPPSENGRHYLCEYPLNPQGALLMVNEQDDDEGVLTLDEQAIERGITTLAEKYPGHWTSILADDDDAETGDALLQCCFFGQVIYG